MSGLIPRSQPADPSQPDPGPDTPRPLDLIRQALDATTTAAALYNPAANAAQTRIHHTLCDALDKLRLAGARIANSRMEKP